MHSRVLGHSRFLGHSRVLRGPVRRGAGDAAVEGSPGVGPSALSMRADGGAPRDELLLVTPTITPTLMLCCFAALIAVASTARESASLVRAMLLPATGPSADLFEPSIREHERAFSLAVQRWVGAAPFGVERPVPPRATTPLATAEPTSPPGPAPAPAAYAGPPLTAIFGAVAFFDGMPLRVGESGRGVTLLAIDPPGDVKVRHEASGHEPGDYAIRLWPRGPSGFIEHEPQNRR